MVDALKAIPRVPSEELTPAVFRLLEAIKESVDVLSGVRGLAYLEELLSLPPKSAVNYLVTGILTLENNHEANFSGVSDDDISMRRAYCHYKKITGATTLTFSGFPNPGRYAEVLLELEDGGSDVTWASYVLWDSGVAPTLTVAGVDLLRFYTRDAGVSVHGVLVSSNSS